jgi:hypothetical protein
MDVRGRLLRRRRWLLSRRNLGWRMRHNWWDGFYNAGCGDTWVVEEFSDETPQEEPEQANVTILTLGQGTVLPEAGTRSYPLGTEVKLTAVPQPGWEFVGWRGDESSSDNALLSLTVDGDKAFTAVFHSRRESAVSLRAPSRITPGAVFTVSVDINQVDSLDACNYDVAFDSQVLLLEQVSNGQIGGVNFPVDVWNERRRGLFTIVQNVPGVAGVSGAGNLAILHFRTIGAAAQHSRIELGPGILSSNVAQEIKASWSGCHILTTSPLRRLDARDITRIERMVAGLNVPNQSGDINHDGAIDARDITEVERLIAGQE